MYTFAKKLCRNSQKSGNVKPLKENGEINAKCSFQIAATLNDLLEQTVQNGNDDMICAQNSFHGSYQSTKVDTEREIFVNDKIMFSFWYVFNYYFFKRSKYSSAYRFGFSVSKKCGHLLKFIELKLRMMFLVLFLVSKYQLVLFSVSQCQ